ncbi:MAG: carbohydrate ABC transporter permease [Candidatus Ranarchaeia archaeon]|jgi:ABC-type sugar transport system permease subunit
MDRKQGILFLLPPFLLIGIPLFCMGFTIVLSFTNASLFGGINTGQFIGLENYIELLGDPLFHTSLRNNFLFLFLLVSFPVVIGLVLAILLSLKVKGETVFKSLFYFPMIVSFVVSGTIWTWMFKTSGGLVNTTLNSLGWGQLAQSWLSDPTLVMVPLAIAGIWHVIGYPVILFSAGLVDIPESVMDASKMEASTFQTYWHVVIPMLKPVILGVTILLTINAFKIFDLIFVMTFGGPVMSTYVLAFLVYMDAISSWRLGYGSAVAVVLLFVSLICISLLIYISNRRRD